MIPPSYQQISQCETISAAQVATSSNLWPRYTTCRRECFSRFCSDVFLTRRSTPGTEGHDCLSDASCQPQPACLHLNYLCRSPARRGIPITLYHAKGNNELLTGHTSSPSIQGKGNAKLRVKKRQKRWGETANQTVKIHKSITDSEKSATTPVSKVKFDHNDCVMAVMQRFPPNCLSSLNLMKNLD